MNEHPLSSIDTPAELRSALREVASNFSFTWHPRARALFPMLDADAWERLDHSPTALLAEVSDDRLAAALDDPGLRVALEDVRRALADDASAPTWWRREHGLDGFLVAYFSAEFGLDESLPLYSGGLGVLAGDHLKSASELGLPLVGVGLFYGHGYFRQALDESGRQVERYPANDAGRLALTLERGPDGTPLEVRVDLAGEQALVRVWRADVGRVALYLLDTDVEGNADDLRAVTSTLYGGDRERRIRQEVVLGVGGVRALEALGLEPSVFHLNEGHSAFLAVERLRRLVAAGRTSTEALARVRGSSVFTTHTPVPAGNEVFDAALARRYLAPLVAGTSIRVDDVLALGRVEDEGRFGMTPFALRTAARANGVSELHGAVSREMWRELWPGRALDGIPIGHVTNGVHGRTWLGAELADALGRDEHGGVAWERARELPDARLWAIHAARRAALAARTGLDPEALTIGFARRFATYKRAGLLFSDPDRLARLLADAARPVQIVLAGKSHPADEGGKDLIQRVVGFTRDSRFAGRVVFLPDYEMTLAAELVQGADVWLNTPRRPMEASGTSGMKAALNGVLNCSILDGWWCEGYAPELGFAVEGAWSEHNDEAQDAADAEALFRVLEEELVPAFYARDEDGLPRRWLGMMRESIAQLGPRFETGRMVAEYVERYYLPAHCARRELAPA